MKNLKILIYIVILQFMVFLLAAEEVKLIFADNIQEISIMDNTEAREPAEIGVSLSPGDTIKTGFTSAELQYANNRSILRLSENTILKIEEFQKAEEPKSLNKLSLFLGKIRTVASRLTGNRYSIRTPGVVYN